MIENHKLWWGSENPRHRPRVCWGLIAAKKARNRHYAQFGDWPHTAHTDRETLRRIVEDICYFTDHLNGPWYEVRVFGMLILEEVE